MSTRSIQTHVTNDPMFAENAYTLYLRDGGACWIVDPGLPPHANDVLNFVADHELRAEAVILTHAHADHIAGVDEILAGVGDVPVYLAEAEWPLLRDPRENLSAEMGMGITVSATNVRDLAPGDELVLEDTKWEVGDVGGHSPAGRSLYCAQESIVLVGDAVFAGSVGRVDFHHSNAEKLMANIHATLMSLPDETIVLSGHGPPTTIGAERSTNPFILHGF